MNKRGQVTVFVIIGVVIIILAALIWYLRDSNTSIRVPGFFMSVEGQIEQVQDNLRSCVEKSVRPTVTLAALQGGEMMPTNYRMFDGYKIPYYCMAITGKNKCYNVMPPEHILADQISDVVKKQIDNCVDRALLPKDVKGSRNLNVAVNMQRNNVIVDTDYDVSFVKGSQEMPIGKMRTVVTDLPFSDLYSTANTITNSWATINDFEPLFYMLSKKGKYEIHVERPYPDVIYILNKKDSNFTYQFAIQGEEQTSQL